MAGVCVKCGGLVGSGNRPCPQCGTEKPLERPSFQCATCSGVTPDGDRTCPHCGVPTLLQRPDGSALVRCGPCGGKVSTAATGCPRCGAPPPRLEPRPKAGTESRAAPQMAAGPPRAAVSSPARPPTPRPMPGEAAAAPPARLIAQTARQDATAGPPADGHSGEPAACRVCGRPNPPGVTTCGHCGLSVRGRDPSAAVAVPRDYGPWVRGGVAVLVLVVTGAVWVYGRQADDTERRQRIYEALGDTASEARVAEIERQAAELAVGTDTLLRVRRMCVLSPTRRPDVAAMRDALAQAPEDRDGALMEWTAARCR